MSALGLKLHPKQGAAFLSKATEILYGGAAGAGKSHLMRVAAISWCYDIPGIQVYLFRRTHPDLWKNHMEGPSSFPALLADWIAAGLVKLNLSDGQVIFWNGSKVHLCHCQHSKDVLKYQGAEIHALLLDELTHFPDDVYRFLRGRCRLGGLQIPERWAGAFPRVLAGANPGGEGHHWVKAAFIDEAEPLAMRKMSPQEGGMVRQYIPARLLDNPTIDRADYAGKLSGLGSEAMVRAMLNGDWDIVAGAFFENWSADRHVIPRWTPPPDWTRFRSMDWGSAKPFSVGWHVVVPETQWLEFSDGTERQVPRGALIRYREWYGCEPGKPNTGLKMDVEDVARGIRLREAGETIDEQMSVADPSMWKQDGGPSFIERMVKIDDGKGPRFRPADNSRVQGWQQVRARLNGDEDGLPQLLVTADCLAIIRTLPALQHDEHRPEDVNSDMEDHAPDDLRYACMGRPLSRVKGPRKLTGPAPWTLAWVEQQSRGN